MASLTLNPTKKDGAGALVVETTGDENMQTPEFQFGSADSNSVEISKKLPMNKDGGVSIKITDMIPDGSQSCGSTLQGRKPLNLSIVGTMQFNQQNIFSNPTF